MSVFNINTLEGYMNSHIDQILYHLEQACIDDVQASLNIVERAKREESSMVANTFVQRYSAKKDMAERIIGKKLMVDEESYLVLGFEERS